MTIRSVCVYCGSSPGKDAAYLQAARALGGEIARRGLTLVYGGSIVGLMGEVARAALEGGGRVIGVIPRSMAEQEIAFMELCELEQVDSMHERKARMAELADGFVSLPGGFGTFEELFEILTWLQLGLHAKPSGLLNIAGYYDHLLQFLRHTVSQGFVHPAHLDMLMVSQDPADLLDRLNAYQPRPGDKAAWVRAMNNLASSKGGGNPD